MAEKNSDLQTGVYLCICLGIGRISIRPATVTIVGHNQTLHNPQEEMKEASYKSNGALSETVSWIERASSRLTEVVLAPDSNRD